jgi:predicted nucleic acid-binding protein
MPEIVVPDASVLLKWAFNSPDETDRDKALKLLYTWLDGRVEIVLPRLWIFEVSNVLMLKNPAQSLEIMNIFIGYNFMECETTLELCRETFKLMERYDVTFYDAVYHAVAMLKDGILLTADEVYCKKVSGMTNVVGLADWQ